MFFAASKIIWPLLSPLNGIFVMAVVGLFLLPLFRRAGQVVLAGALTLFILLGLFPLGPGLLAGLENQHMRPARLPPTVDGIIVLGGVFETPLAQARGVMVMNDGAERILEATRLAVNYPEAKLVFSGGEGYLRGTGNPESNEVRAFLSGYSIIDAERALYEEKSRNTYENVAFSRELVAPKAGERWIVVTSAFHMPRAMKVFQSAGWPGIIPWPVDYRTGGGVSFLPRRFDVGGNFYQLDVALHEYVGMLYYRLTGKIGKTSGKQGATP